MRYNWSSLLHHLQLENIFDKFPKFDADTPLFISYIDSLEKPLDTQYLYNLYDNLFKECLIHIKALEPINQQYLIGKIESAKEGSAGQVRRGLERYLELLKSHPEKAMHNLVFYLAWDRMCACMAKLFDYQSTSPTFQQNLRVLKECLLESYSHIKSTGGASPNFYRLMEALFFYQMREEMLQQHSEEDWTLLNKGFTIFNAPDELIDFSYEESLDLPPIHSKGKYKEFEIYFLKIIHQNHLF